MAIDMGRTGTSEARLTTSQMFAANLPEMATHAGTFGFNLTGQEAQNQLAAQTGNVVAGISGFINESSHGANASDSPEAQRKKQMRRVAQQILTSSLLQNIEVRIRDTEKRISILNQNIDDTKHKITRLTEQEADITTKIEEEEEAIEDTVGKLEEAEDAAEDAKDAQSAAQDADGHTYGSKRKQSEQNLKDADNDVATADERVEGFKEELKERRGNLNSLKEQFGEVQKDIIDTQEQLRLFEAKRSDELDTLKEQKLLHQNLEDLQNERNGLTSEIKHLETVLGPEEEVKDETIIDFMHKNINRIADYTSNWANSIKAVQKDAIPLDAINETNTTDSTNVEIGLKTTESSLFAEEAGDENLAVSFHGYDDAYYTGLYEIYSEYRLEQIRVNDKGVMNATVTDENGNTTSESLSATDLQKIQETHGISIPAFTPDQFVMNDFMQDLEKGNTPEVPQVLQELVANNPEFAGQDINTLTHEDFTKVIKDEFGDAGKIASNILIPSESGTLRDVAKKMNAWRDTPDETISDTEAFTADANEIAKPMSPKQQAQMGNIAIASVNEDRAIQTITSANQDKNGIITIVDLKKNWASAAAGNISIPTAAPIANNQNDVNDPSVTAQPSPTQIASLAM